MPDAAPISCICGLLPFIRSRLISTRPSGFWGSPSKTDAINEGFAEENRADQELFEPETFKFPDHKIVMGSEPHAEPETSAVSGTRIPLMIQSHDRCRPANENLKTGNDVDVAVAVDVGVGVGVSVGVGVIVGVCVVAGVAVGVPV